MVAERPEPTTRIHFRSLALLVEGGQQIGQRVLAGSVPPVVPEPITDGPIDATLRAELEEVRRLRSGGMTYEQIGEHLDRSIYWVHSRLKGRYQPNDVRTERLFQEQAVIPFLVDAGHVIGAQCA